MMTHSHGILLSAKVQQSTESNLAKTTSRRASNGYSIETLLLVQCDSMRRQCACVYTVYSSLGVPHAETENSQRMFLLQSAASVSEDLQIFDQSTAREHARGYGKSKQHKRRTKPRSDGLQPNSRELQNVVCQPIVCSFPSFTREMSIPSSATSLGG